MVNIRIINLGLQRRFCDGGQVNIEKINDILGLQDEGKEYRIMNKEKLQEHRKNNKEKHNIKESQNKYLQNNLDKIKESQKEYRKKNLDKIKDNQREYKMLNSIKQKEIQKENLLKQTLKENRMKKLDINLSLERKKDKDKYKENQREYRLKNKTKLVEYKVNNKDKIKETEREYTIKNKDKINEMKKDYRKINKNKKREIRMKKKKDKNPNYIPNYSWKSSEEARINLESIASLLKITDLSGWYRISQDQIKQIGGGSIIVKFGSLKNALVYAYSEYPWDSSKFIFRGKKSTQRWLYFKLKELLPNSEIIEDFYHPDLVWDKINRTVQLDIWISDYNIALEYQGEHHYYDLHNAYGTGSTTKMFNERDEEKKKMCLDKGISLIYIPYWWDRTLESLSSTLHQTHPNVFPKTNSPPIPTTPPNNIELINKKSGRPDK